MPRLIAVAGLLFALPALAGTWQWRDAAGRMVYSDLPPPPAVPASQILRSPLQAPSVAAAAPPPAAAAPAPANQSPAGARSADSASPAAPRTWVEKEQESRKRAAEREESERKQREEREQLARTERACEDARAALRTLESGIRINVVNAQGQPEVLDDGERARRVDAARKEIARSCEKGG